MGSAHVPYLSEGTGHPRAGRAQHGARSDVAAGGALEADGRHGGKQCYKCGQRGHIRANCPKGKGGQQQDGAGNDDGSERKSRWCGYCHSATHNEAVCYRKLDNVGKQLARENRGKAPLAMADYAYAEAL